MPLLAPPVGLATAYDFRRPPWISREQRAVLDGLHSRLLPAVAQQISATLHQPVHLSLRDAAQVSFSSWRMGLPTPCVVLIFPTGPRGEGCVAIDSRLAGSLVDAALGGTGERADDIGSLTAIEQAVAGRVGQAIVRALCEGYREIVAVEPGPARFEEIAARVALVEPHERLYTLDLEIRLGEVSGNFTFALPATLLDPFLQSEAPPPAGPAGPAARPLLEAQVRTARVPVVVRLPGFRLRAADGAALEAGQILETNHPFQGTVEVHVQDRRLFLGALGCQHGHVGLRIIAPITGPPSPPRLMRRTDTT